MTQIDHPLVQTLGEITSQDPKRIKLGEERLTEWVRQPGYHLSLLVIKITLVSFKNINLY
jgi:hypothetical protein